MTILQYIEEIEYLKLKIRSLEKDNEKLEKQNEKLKRELSDSKKNRQ